MRLLPSTTLLPRGETFLRFPITNIQKLFKDFSSTTRKYSKTFHQQHENTQRLFACRIVLAADHQNPGNIRRLPASKQYPSSNQPAAATSKQYSSSNQQSFCNQPQQSTAATSNSNQQRQPAAATNYSNRQHRPATAISSSNQQQ